MASSEVNARAIVRADNRKLASDLNKTKRLFGKAFKGVAGGIKGAMSSALGPLGLFGGGAVAVVGKSVMEFEDSLQRLQSVAGKSDKEIAAFRSSVIQTSKDTGIAREEILSGVRSLVDLQGAAGFSEEKLAVLTEAALGTGESMESLAGLTYALDNAFQVKSAEDLKAALSGIISAGDQGSVPISAMSASLQQLSVQFADFGARVGPQAAIDLAIAMQVARKGFSSAEEAATGVQSAMVAILRNADKLKTRKGGKIQVYAPGVEGGKRQLRDIGQLFNEMGKLDQGQMIDIFGRVDAAKLLYVMNKFSEERSRLSEIVKNDNALERHAAERRASMAFRWTKAVNAGKEAIAKLFTPENIEKFTAAIQKVGMFIEFAVDHLAAFAALWAGMKIASWTASLTTLAVEFSKLKSGAAMAGAAISKAGAAMGAFGIGFAAGTIIYDLFGKQIDDLVERSLDGLRKVREGSGFIRDRAKSFDAYSASKRFGTGGISDEAGVGQARNLVRSAKESGLIDEGGNVNRDQVWQVAASASSNPVEAQAEAVRLARVLEEASAIVQQSSKIMAQGLKVVVAMDPSTGQMSATASSAAARRSPQQ